MNIDNKKLEVYQVSTGPLSISETTEILRNANSEDKISTLPPVKTDSEVKSRADILVQFF